MFMVLSDSTNIHLIKHVSVASPIWLILHVSARIDEALHNMDQSNRCSICSFICCVGSNLCIELLCSGQRLAVFLIVSPNTFHQSDIYHSIFCMLGTSFSLSDETKKIIFLYFS